MCSFVLPTFGKAQWDKLFDVPGIRTHQAEREVFQAVPVKGTKCKGECDGDAIDGAKRTINQVYACLCCMIAHHCAIASDVVTHYSTTQLTSPRNLVLSCSFPVLRDLCVAMLVLSI